MISGDPGQGGATWAVLQYVLGLRRLGHDVFLVEPVDALTDARVSYFNGVVESSALHGRAALLETGSGRTVGASRGDIDELALRADALFNVSGMLTDEALRAPIPRRVYLDLGPAFVQLWHAVERIDMGFAGHTHFVTV